MRTKIGYDETKLKERKKEIPNSKSLVLNVGQN